ncbi:MAG: Glycotrans2-like domain-containing protein [Nitrospira sp.]|nr:MAG: Glycotrans2-like domain-containing protein [Nitrospira sp.]
MPDIAPRSVSRTSSRIMVSVVIPTYNRGPFLRTAIVSALAQEQVGELFDLEVIVVDDCSSDDMSHIATAFPGVQYVRLPQNRGASGARNAGIHLAKGKYVALLDDDDEFLTHKLMVQLPIMEANPEIGVVYGQSVVTGADTPLLLWPESGPSGDVFEEFLTRTDDFLHPPTWLVRRELFEAAGWFDEQHRTMEHYDMALRLAALTQWKFLSGGPVAHGRFSKRGKWYSNIANGTNEQRLPRIVENALKRLPATPDAERIRRKARAAVCATIAGQRWSIGAGLESTRTYLLTALRAAPWLIQEPVVLAWINRVAITHACSSTQPVRAVRTFWSEIIESIGGRVKTQTWCPRRILGAMLEATALDMMVHSPRRAWMVALSVLLHDPHYWIEPARLIHVCRALLMKRDVGREGNPSSPPITA